MQAPKVNEFSDPVEFINATLRYQQSRNPRFSIRAWARQVGLTQSAGLSMVLNRRRRLTLQLCQKLSSYYLARQLMLPGDEKYFQILTLRNNASSDAERDLYWSLLRELSPQRDVSELSIDQFRFIADWYHFVILDMVELPDFNPDPAMIAKRIGHHVQVAEIQFALERLERLNLIVKEGRSFRKTQRELAFDPKAQNQSLRRFHKQMLGFAAESLDSQSLSERDVTGHMMAISRQILPEAKELIKKFRKDLSSLVAQSLVPCKGRVEHTDEGRSLEEPDDVYYLGVQFFSILGGKYADPPQSNSKLLH